MAQSVPSTADVVVIGGGVIGTSIAYHLAKRGCGDVLLLERKQFACGTTWHAAGLVARFRGSYNLTELGKYSADLLVDIEKETGQATGFKQVGSLYLASDAERWEELKRTVSVARGCGIEMHRITPAEVKDLYPIVNETDLIGGVFSPMDGQASPIDVTQAFAKGGRMHGASLIEGVKVTDVLVEAGRVVGVETDQGEIRSKIVVNCAGMWAHEVGRMAGVNVPLHACEHFYLVTEKIPDLPNNLPVMRDQSAEAYFKEDAGSILLGAFEKGAKPWGMDGIPEDFSFDELPEDFDHFAPVLEKAMHRVPLLGEVGIRKFFNGPESFTPDDRFHLGEAPEVRGFFVAAGLNSIGIQTSGGIGKYMADWIIDGHPPVDLSGVDIRRMQPFQGNRAYLRDRVSETLGLLYDHHFPYRQFESSRGVRHSALHEKLVENGAVFGEAAGWERPNWFAPEGVEPVYEYSYARQNWFEHSAAEHMAARETAALFDLSSFCKFMVQGRDAEKVLQRICGNDVAVEPGRLVYTQWLNERAGIEADLTVMRLAEDKFQVTSSAGTAVRDFDWLNRHIPDDAHCIATDVTPAITVLGLMGPNSRALLEQVSGIDLSNEAFPFGTSREIEIGYAMARACRISYVGELGWELHISSDMARHVFDTLMAAGIDHGLRLAGMHALDSCRIEKAYRHFGHDISDEDTPIEAGLSFACKPDKAVAFIGRDAFLRQKEKGVPSKRLVQFQLTDPAPLVYHEEPIWKGNTLVGRVTSANYGHYLGGSIALGYVQEPGGVTADFIAYGGFEIEVAGERCAAKASLRPLYDPKSERMKA